ncbi:MAG TPA: family 43 glycosylhydrolase, partial [Deinococcales bacterium]|nr:family 43 glycosylhydrolase [Deinococcales bacterium]
MTRRSIAPILAALLGVAALAAPAVKTPVKPAPKPAVTARTFTNPVINSDFPDPFILRSGKTFFAFATNAGGLNVQVASSPDLVNWISGPDALPNLGSWASTGNTWA